jgi:hypothetical protein
MPCFGAGRTAYNSLKVYGIIRRFSWQAWAKPKDVVITLFDHRGFLPYNGQRHCACHLDLFRTHPDSVERSRTRGIRCDRASRCDEKWETAMLEIATHLLAAGLLSGCGFMGSDAGNLRPDPTASSRLQYALAHQPKVRPNECVVLGADYVWRPCQGGRLFPH